MPAHPRHDINLVFFPRNCLVVRSLCLCLVSFPSRSKGHLAQADEGGHGVESAHRHRGHSHVDTPLASASGVSTSRQDLFPSLSFLRPPENTQASLTLSAVDGTSAEELASVFPSLCLHINLVVIDHHHNPLTEIRDKTNRGA